MKGEDKLGEQQEKAVASVWETIPSGHLIAEFAARSWKDRAIGLDKRFGAPAKFAAKMLLGAALPDGSAVVDLVGEVLDCVHETDKGNLVVVRASAADLQRVEEVLAVLANELNPLMAQMTALADLPERAAQALDAALATDERCRHALHRLDQMARRFDRLEERNKKLLQGQGYAAGMLAEMLPLMRRMVGVADYIDDLCTAGVSAADFRSCLHEFQDAARAFRAGRIAEAETHFEKAARSQPQSAAVATALAGTPPRWCRLNHEDRRIVARSSHMQKMVRDTNGINLSRAPTVNPCSG